MKVDFSPYLRIQKNGRIWWRLMDAVKLGAGYVLMRDDTLNPIPTLQAPSQPVLTEERNLLSEFSHGHYGDTHPRWIVRDGERWVEAQEFLDWLASYSADKSDASVVRARELARAVWNAKMAPNSRAATEPEFESLALALAGRFGGRFVELPEVLRTRVKREFCPLRWDDLDESQRLSLARQNDYRNDPAFDTERELLRELGIRKDALEREIVTWADAPATTANELGTRTRELATLRKQLAVINRQERS